MLGNSSSESAQFAANAGLMAAAQVLVQQQRFESVMSERVERERAQEAAEREELRRAAADRLEKDAVILNLSESSEDNSPQSGSGSENPPPLPAAEQHAVDISA